MDNGTTAAGHLPASETTGPAQIALPPLLTSVRAARNFVAGVLAESGRDDLVDDAALAVSEIVTNAIVHARTPVDISVRPVDRGMRIAVADGSANMPLVGNPADTAVTGRGLRVVAELADQWGVLTHSGGKTVWFELGEKDGSGPPSPPSDA